MAQCCLVLERPVLGAFLDKEIKRIDDRHVRDQVNIDAQQTRFFSEHQACLEIPERILLPVDEMLLRLNFQRIGMNRRPAMRCRPQAQDMRAQRDQPVEAVFGLVMDCNADCHSNVSLCGHAR